MQEISVPVLIVGGGGCGLSTSLFLSNLGIESLLIEKHTKPSPMPKARYLNQRTMEIFRQHKFADAIYERSIPNKHIAKVRWATSLGGDGPFDRKVLHEMDSYGGGSMRARYMKDSPCETTIYPQMRLEPLMKEHADKIGPGRLTFGYELVSFEQDANEVHSIVKNRDTSEILRVRSKYLVAADAGKTVGPLVGSILRGTPELVDMVTVYFKADLSKYIDDEHVMTIWLSNTQGDTSSWGSGVLGKLGPKHFGRYSEEWMFHFSFPPDHNGKYDAAVLIPRIRQLLKVPELEPEILGIGHWIVQGVLADKFRFGRVFLAGDSAHRHTPTTGLGLNSAVQDAHNLAWKLALVLRGQASDALLDTYEPERRSADARNVEWALFTFSNHALTGAAMGRVPGDDKRTEENFAALLADTPDGVVRRTRFANIMDTVHRTEMRAHDMEIGVRYETGAIVADGSVAPPIDPLGFEYIATTRPGHRLPHAWVRVKEKSVSTHDLFDLGMSFLLIIEDDAELWKAAAETVNKRFGVRIKVVSIGDAKTCDASDVDHEWRNVREIACDGAILVRPDNIVGWRTMGLADKTAALPQLASAVARILGRNPAIED